MDQPHHHRSCLPLPLPESRIERTVLFALRRMAAHGVRDANAAWLMLDLFGVRFRRPLVLLRAFVLELAHSSRGPIRIAPCCTARMTVQEGAILAVLFGAGSDIDTARDVLSGLTGNPGIDEPLSAAAVFSRAVAAIPARNPTVEQGSAS